MYIFFCSVKVSAKFITKRTEKKFASFEVLFYLNRFRSYRERKREVTLLNNGVTYPEPCWFSRTIGTNGVMSTVRCFIFRVVQAYIIFNMQQWALHWIQTRTVELRVTYNSWFNVVPRLSYSCITTTPYRLLELSEYQGKNEHNLNGLKY